MNIKDKATHIRRLQNDEAFTMLIAEIKEDTANVFLNPHSSVEDRESAHQIIRALAKIEERMAKVLTDEAIFDKNEGRSGPWKRLIT